MNKQFPEIQQNRPGSRKFGEAQAYSAHIQEAMRYDRLSSSNYHIAMTILSAVSAGYTEEQWKEEQQRMVKALISQPPAEGVSHSDSANRYEQLVNCLQDLKLWPW